MKEAQHRCVATSKREVFLTGTRETISLFFAPAFISISDSPLVQKSRGDGIAAQSSKAF